MTYFTLSLATTNGSFSLTFSFYSSRSRFVVTWTISTKMKSTLHNGTWSESGDDMKCGEKNWETLSLGHDLWTIRIVGNFFFYLCLCTHIMSHHSCAVLCKLVTDSGTHNLVLQQGNRNIFVNDSNRTSRKWAMIWFSYFKNLLTCFQAIFIHSHF